ncbi:MAG: type II toxin-antitoxin system VapC family toxin [Candidatus Bathyarchaeia archaeon]
MLRFYLDTSAMLKHYVTEPGTEIMDTIYDKAETGDLSITISLWNIGEFLGALDQKRRRGWLSEKEFERLEKNFADELLKFIRLKSIEIIPVQTQILTETWNVLMNYHLYEADALQIATCIESKNDALISSDEKLVDASRKNGLKALHISKDENDLIALINKS